MLDLEPNTNLLGYHGPEVALLVRNILDAIERDLLFCNGVELWN